MMTFTYKDKASGFQQITKIADDDITLDDLLPHIEGFLRGCTYTFDGELQIVDEKDKQDESTSI